MVLDRLVGLNNLLPYYDNHCNLYLIKSEGVDPIIIDWGVLLYKFYITYKECALVLPWGRC